MTTTSTSPPSSSEIGRRLALIRERIAAAGGAGVEILAVTKTFGLPEVLAARDAGLHAVGENYAQEVVAKFGGASLDIAVHFIGQLQTNKVRQLVGLVDVVESVDRPSLVDELAKRMPGLRVLVQVDTSGDPGKGGCPVADVDALVERARAKGLDVAGLMTVGPTEGGPEAARPGFRTVRAMVDRLGLAVCSMGMSDDLEVAVAAGATEVRIGSALFGPRVRPGDRPVG
jgi:pyridoxal phosphate enzyme (YggS family)